MQPGYKSKLSLAVARGLQSNLDNNKKPLFFILISDKKEKIKNIECEEKLHMCSNC